MAMKRLVLASVATLTAVLIALWLVQHWGKKAGSEARALTDNHATFQAEAGEIVPDADFSSLHSGTLRLTDVMKREGTKIALINFWATWCEGCVTEMPSLNLLYQDFQAKGFTVLAVSVDDNPAQVLPRFLDRIGVKFPIYVDRGQKLAELFHVNALPVSFIVDQNLRILQVEVGDRNWNTPEIRARMEAWLNAP